MVIWEVSWPDEARLPTITQYEGVRFGKNSCRVKVRGGETTIKAAHWRFFFDNEVEMKAWLKVRIDRAVAKLMACLDNFEEVSAGKELVVHVIPAYDNRVSNNNLKI